MKKNLTVSFIILAICSAAHPSYAGITKTVSYKISVTIPPHVMEPRQPASTIPSLEITKENSVQDSNQETIREEARRNQETVSLQTSVVK